MHRKELVVNIKVYPRLKTQHNDEVVLSRIENLFELQFQDVTGSAVLFATFSFTS